MENYRGEQHVQLLTLCEIKNTLITHTLLNLKWVYDVISGNAKEFMGRQNSTYHSLLKYLYDTSRIDK